MSLFKNILVFSFALLIALEFFSFLLLQNTIIQFNELEKNTVSAYENGESGNVFSPFYGYDVDGEGDNDIRTTRYDYKKNEDEFVIAVLGGSVAHYFSEVYGFLPLKNEIFKSYPKIKNIKIIPLALGGYKQPQQQFLFQFSLLAGAKYDLVLLIDGYNECVYTKLNLENGVNPIYPSVHHLNNITKQLYNNFNISDAKYLIRKEKIKTRIKFISKFSNSNSNFLKYCYHQLSSYYINTLNTLKYNYNTKLVDSGVPNSLTGKHLISDTKIADPYKYSASLWANSSRMINDICKANNIPYFHFLQPNQYVKDSKILSKEEMKNYYKPDSYGAKCIIEGYSSFIKDGKELKKELPFFNLTNIFKNEKGTIYVDECCHFFDIGNKIMAKSIMDSITTFTKKHNTKIFNLE